MTPTLQRAATRDYEAVRLSIDAKLGPGVGLVAADAVLELEPVEHVVWALDNLLACLFEGRFHLWDQGFNSAAYDGARVLEGLAEVGRESDPLIADLLSWTARYAKTRPIALTSVVPELWALHAQAARRFLFDVAGRWPEALDPFALPEVPRFDRKAPRAPVAVGFTDQGAGCPSRCAPADQHRDGVFRVVLGALWQAGAADQTLEDFFLDYFARDAREVDVVCRYVSFDGDGGDDARRAALQLAIHPVDPFAARLGIDEVEFPSLVRVEALADLEGHLGGWNTRLLEGPSLAQSARSALRTDPDALLFDAALLQEGDVELLLHALFTGHVLVVAGQSPLLQTLLTGAVSVPVYDRRSHS